MPATRSRSTLRGRSPAKKSASGKSKAKMSPSRKTPTKKAPASKTKATKATKKECAVQGNNTPGNVANVIMLINTVSFLIFMLSPFGPIHLSESYLSDGFCVSNPSTLLSSHHLCFYFDSLSSLFLYFYVKSLPPSPTNSKVIQTLPGVVAHGLGHLSLGTFYPPSTILISSRPLWFQLFASSGMSLFFYMMFLSIPTISPSSHITLSLLYGTSNILLIPPTFSFTFVQSTLLLTVGYYDLLSPSKPELYNPWSIIVNTPISFIGWLEAFKCEDGVKYFGGHFIYDATIPVCLWLFVEWTSRVNKVKVN
ncbi:hypothetical protein TrVE_jg13151 [Triparma verrucosa]|uniref:Uncharacterized protein n=1 Tax=Triparma verrucosa TaxID=1606542 RepID=A0A9W7BM12_9STRA|nr:hypothetical protein TrVE_jg13151 [Triparma verrucosa]